MGCGNFATPLEELSKKGNMKQPVDKWLEAGLIQSEEQLLLCCERMRNEERNPYEEDSDEN